MAPPKTPKADFPWWLLALGFLWLAAMVVTLSSPAEARILGALLAGVKITVLTTITAFLIACCLGLAIAMMALSRHFWLRQVARFYTELLRGLPILVLLLYIAFVFSPVLVAGWNVLLGFFGLEPILSRDFPFLWRAILALSIGYSAFIAKVFRAGIQAVDQGQTEAGLSLGLSRFQVFRLVVLPQALRSILPALGNDFIALVKDSSLVSVLGVADVTQAGKIAAAGNFRYLETYNLVALIYLTMTVILSLLLRRLEARLRGRER